MRPMSAEPALSPAHQAPDGEGARPWRRGVSKPDASSPSNEAAGPEAPGVEAAKGPLNARASRPPREARWWSVGDDVFTITFWGAIAIFIGALFRTQALPFVDYPQHLALAATLRRTLGGGPEAVLFEANLASYNSLFHVLVALCHVVLPIDAAGKLVLGGYIALTGAATLALLREAGRPRERAFLVLPVLMGYSIVWGFVNFGFGVAIQLLTLSRVIRRVEGRTPPSLRADALTAALALLGVWSHLLGSALAYMLMLTAIVVRVQAADEPLGARLKAALRTGAPLLPAIGYAYWVYRHQNAGPHVNYEYASSEGNDVPALAKVRDFLTYATGLRLDEHDATVLLLALALLVLGAALRDERDRPPPYLRWFFVVSLVSYLVVPHVLWATCYVFERISFFIVLSLVLWAPRARPRLEAALRPAYVAVGLAAAGLFFQAMGAAGVELADLDRVLEDAPAGRRVTGLVFAPKTPSTHQWSLLHSPAYYVARKGGEVAFSFTRTMSLPVHYRPEKMPPALPFNFEWMPQAYQATAPYARYFDLVLMKTTYDDNKDHRVSVWGEFADQVKVVAHHGKWWVFDTSAITASAPPAPPASGPAGEPDEPDEPEG